MLKFLDWLNETENHKNYDAINEKNLNGASDLIIKLITKKTGVEWKSIPTPIEFTREGGNYLGIHYFNDKNLLSIRINSAKRGPGIVHSIDLWVNGGDFEKPDYSFIFGEIPVTLLLNDICNMILNPRSIAQEVNESVLYEGGASIKLDNNQIERIKKLLSKGKTAKHVSKYLKIPYSAILKVKKGEKTPIVESVETKTNKSVLSDKIKIQEALMQDIYDITIAITKKKMRGLFITGKAGTGKSYNVEAGLKDAGLKEDKDYFYVKGSISSFQMFKKLYQYRDKIVVFDDADSVFADQEARNILKAALDSKEQRFISFMKRNKELYDVIDAQKDPFIRKLAKETGQIPNKFEFKGSVIFISNLPKDKADPDGAISSRSILIDINPDDLTLLEIIKKMLPQLEPKSLSLEEKEEIFEFIKETKNVSLRSFEKAAMFKVSGLKNWKRMAQNYL